MSNKKESVKNTKKKFASISTQLKNRVTILKWMPKYSRLDLISDMVAGLSVGLTMIPQSIAYAGLAGLPAQYGLYTAFIGSFTYIFFGTIKQVSIGPTSLMSILTFSYVEGLGIEYVVLLSFLAGCVELLMGIFKLGFLVEFISPCVSAGFTTSTSLIIIIAQLKNFLGLKLTAHSVLELLYKIPANYAKIKLGDTLMGVGCLLFLYIFKKLGTIRSKNKILNKTLWFMSISKNASCVLIAACLGYYFLEWRNERPFVLAGNVPSGLPSFHFPRFSSTNGNETVGFFGMVANLGSGVIVVPVCAILANVAIAKSFASGIIVDASQEMITLGLCNIFGSCVQAMPSCGAFSRSAVANSSGVRTPLQGIYSGACIILALSFLTPYFYYIPKSTLAAVLIFAVTSLIDFELLGVLWKTNRFDFWMNAVTCLVGVFYGADIGIILGAVLNLIVLLKLWTRPEIETKIYSKGKGQEYLLIKPELGLCYPCIDYFTEEVIRHHLENKDLPMAIDCQNILKVDYSGAQLLHKLLETYNNETSQLVLLNVSPKIYLQLEQFVEGDKLHLCQSTDSISEEIFDRVKSIDNGINEPLLRKNSKNIALSNIVVENTPRERKITTYDDNDV